MRHNFTFLFLSFLTFQLFAQENFHAGINITSGYSINQTQTNSLFLLQPEITNTIPVELGVFFEYRPLNRIQMSVQANVEYNYYSVSFIDLKTLEEEKSSSGILFFSDTFRMSDDYPVFSLKVPARLKFFVIKQLYMSGGAGMKIYFTNALKNSWEPFYQFGIGGSGKKFGWNLFVESPFINNSFYISEDYITKHYPDVGVDFSSRSIKLSLTYNLWSR
jgi:hypothetical protein